MRLIWFEAHKWLKNPVFYAALCIIVLFAGSQLGEGGFANDMFRWPEPPPPGLAATPADPAPYGWRKDQSQEARMQGMIKALYLAALENPVIMPALGGFINRQVKLSPAQVSLVREAFADITGKSADDIGSYHDNMPAALSGSEFWARLQKLNDALGGAYFAQGISSGEYVPRTYEEALADYQALVRDDHVTRAYARYFSDYMGIALSLFPAFLAAFMMGKDRRSGAEPLIDTRPVRGVTYVAVKYLGLMLPLAVFVILAGCIPTIGAIALRVSGHNADVLAYLWHCLAWLIPTVLSVSALSLFISIVSGSGIAALPVAVIWWAVSVGSGFHGPYPLYVAAIRFNSIGRMTSIWAGQITANRLLLLASSALLVLLGGLVYEYKRARGGGYV